MLTNKLKDKLSISEIAEWQQQAPEDTLVQLPKIQRGFVWKSSQIENIWDSILRGFPIGSFLFSITGDGHYNLMDGQQRATAIALGFFNQYESDRFDFWRLEDPDHFQTVWLDLAPKEFGNNKYLIRVTTRSHPWGYKAKNNGDRLSVKDMQEALKNFKRDAQLQYEDRYYEFSNTKIYPYDTTMPVPLSVLLDEKYNYDADSIIAYLKQVIPPFIKTKHGSFTNREEYIEQLSTLYYEKLKLILSIIGTRIFGEGKLLVNHDDLSNDVLNDDQGETDKESESPILFVRMNTAGTRLSNDDLIYSLYKSIFPDSQSLVEEAGLGFLTAPQVMSLVARLAES
ncbi:MAG: DUF262 domain-containing protein [Lactobacillaceae bacterium]|jgi:hypothetical protein|nr:DUF262 domain-containing protein [Lactobacillaceae bacterium]